MITHISIDLVPVWTQESIQSLVYKHDERRAHFSLGFELNPEVYIAVIERGQYVHTNEWDGDWSEWHSVFLIRQGKPTKHIYDTHHSVWGLVEYVSAMHLSRSKKSLVLEVTNEEYGGPEDPELFRVPFLLSDLK